MFVMLVQPGRAQSTWNGGGVDGNWSTAANWTSGTAPVSSNTTAIVFAGNTQLGSNVDSAFTIGDTSGAALSFASGAGNFVVGGTTISLHGSSNFNADINNKSAGTETINNNITLTSASGIQNSVAGGNLVLNGNIATGGNSVGLLATGGVLTLNGAITGAGSMIVDGNASGTIALNGNSSFTGGVNLYTATLELGANALANTNGPLGNSNSSINMGAASGNLAPTLLTNGAVTVGRTVIVISTTNSGITPTDTVTIGGIGANVSNFTANINLNSFAVSGTVIAMPLTVTAGAGGQVNFSGNIVDNSGGGATIITGADSITKTGLGTVSLSGANIYLGGTYINQGVLSVTTLANGSAVSSIGASSNVAGNLVFNSGTLLYTGTATTTNRLFSVGTSNGTIMANGTGAVNFNNTGSMGFNGQTGARTLTLSGTNTGSNTLAASINDNSGATSLVKNGNGTWILSGSSTYTGGTVVNAGSLLVKGSLSGSSSLTVAAGASVSVGRAAGSVSGQTLNTASCTLNLGASLSTESNITLSLGASGNSDEVAVTGALNLLGGGAVNLVLNDATGGSLSGTYTLMTWGSGGFTNPLSQIDLTGSSPDISASQLQVVGNTLVYEAIPEPSTCGLVALGLAAAWRMSRRKRAAGLTVPCR